jgi:5,10-methylenetetrahydromethanopterin reductase
MTAGLTGTAQGAVGLALGHDPALAVSAMSRIAARAEAAGFHTVFFSETMGSNRDSVTALAAFALATKRVQLAAIQVVRLRSPLLMAQTMATLDELSEGRLVIALGAFTPRHARRHGLPPSPVHATLREYVECIRLLLGGKLVTYRGQYVDIEGVGLGWKPVRDRIPIWIAANSPGGLRCAAEIGDGVLLDGATSPGYTASAMARIRDVAREVGRDIGGFRVAQLINTSVAESTAAARGAVRPEIAARFRTALPAAAKAAIGDPVVDPGDLPGFVRTFEAGGAPALESQIPEEYVAGLSASGTSGEVAARLAAYREAGVDLPLLRPASAAQTEELLRLFGKSPTLRAGPAR